MDFILQPLGTEPKQLSREVQRTAPSSRDLLAGASLQDEPAQRPLEPPGARRPPSAGGSKPWWWSYFMSLSPHRPRWLLKY